MHPPRNSFPLLRKRWRPLAPLSVVLLLFFFGCSAGELNLSRGQEADSSSGGQVVDSSTGGQDADPPSTGGQDADGIDDGEDLPAASAGGTEGDGDSMSHDDDFDMITPCLVSGLCDCPGDGQDCLSCERGSMCPRFAPLCDNFLERCVECFDDRECVMVFGEYFGTCAGGRCVQCQSDDDCSDGDVCDHGYCGTCAGPEECAEDEVCLEGHCLHQFYLPPNESK